MQQQDELQAMYNKAVMQQEAGNQRQADDLCQEILAIDPEHIDTLKFFAAMKLEGKQWQEAIPYLERAKQVKEEDAAVFVNLGVAYKNTGNLDKALEYYQLAAKLAPQSYIVHNNLGNLYRDLGKLEDALQCFERSIELHGRQVKSYKNLGLTLRDLHRNHEAIIAFKKALECDPSYNELYSLLGDVLEMEGYFRKAMQQYRSVLATEPSNAAVVFKLALCMPIIYPSTEFMDEQHELFKKRVEALAEDPPALVDPLHDVGKTNFLLAYHGKNDVEIQKTLAQAYLKSKPELAWQAPHCENYQPPKEGERIKIGFVSAYMHNHTIGKLLCGMIANLDKQAFELFIFTPQRAPDEVSQYLRKHAEHFIECPNDTIGSRELIANEAVDVLIHAGVLLSPWNYFLSFARLAPVQCVTWGHPVTTGVPNMDYFISSEHLEVANSDEHYSEHLLRLKQLSVYHLPLARNQRIKTRSDFGLPEDANLYFCPQTLFKLHPEFDDYFNQILQRDPNGRLVLITGNQQFWNQNIQARLQQAMPEVYERVIYLDKLEHLDFLDVMARCDVLLDTIHFSGGLSSYEAFMVGTPVVTQASEFRRARITHALYQEMGIDEASVDSKEDYINKAVQLGTDEEYRNRLSTKILENNHHIVQNMAAVEEFTQMVKSLVRS